MNTDINKLARSWILAHKCGVDSLGYDRNFWAVEELINIAREDPDRLWESILQILDSDDSEEISKAVGAGPLEDLVVFHGSSFIDKIESQAAVSTRFRSTMKFVWLDSDDSEFADRFYEIAGVSAPFT